MLTLLAIATAAWVWHSSNAVPAPEASAVGPPATTATSTPAVAPPVVAVAAVAAQPLKPAPAAAPAPPAVASIGDMLQAPASPDWRWKRFKPNPAILVIEFPGLHEQGLAMNRLAAMFEKRAARRDRLVTEAELNELMQRSGDTIASFYQGHDYPAAKIARFFTLAAQQQTPLNPQELRLRSVLVDAGLLSAGVGGAYDAVGEQAAISFTAAQPDDPATAADEGVDARRREAVLRHELSHGEYFTNPAYRAHAVRYWKRVLNDRERKMFRAHLKSLEYDPTDEDLMANETQALLMHTPDTRAFNARHLGLSDAALASLRQRFHANEPRHGLNQAAR